MLNKLLWKSFLCKNHSQKKNIYMEKFRNLTIDAQNLATNSENKQGE